MEINSARKTILVIDDDTGVLEYASNALEDCGYTVLAAPDGATALVMLRNRDDIDLLFTDVVMPGLDGVELARRARQESPDLKVLFTSGYTENAIMHHGRLDSGILLLAKPYRKSELARMIRKALET